MQRYIVIRLMQMVPILFGVTVLVFVIIQLAPGGPEVVLLGADEAGGFDRAFVEEYRRNLGLDQPIFVQYARWVGLLLQGDLGRSFSSGIPILQEIRPRILPTLQLTVASMLFALIVAVPVGVYSAVRRNTATDHILTATSFFGLSFPNFWLGLMLILIFGYILGWFPMSGMSTFGRERDILNRLHHMVLPVITLSTAQMAAYVRFIRASMIETLGQDYIRTAWAKGLAGKVVVFRHALRNGLLAPITLLGTALNSLFGGAALTEIVFAWPGMGRLAVNAVFERDYPLVMSITLMSAFLVMLGNLLADVLYAVADPRIRYD